MNAKQEIKLYDEILEAFKLTMELNIRGEKAMFVYNPGIAFSVHLMGDDDKIVESIDGYLGDYWEEDRKTVKYGLVKLKEKLMKIKEDL